jgi:hypothetical protein
MEAREATKHTSSLSNDQRNNDSNYSDTVYYALKLYDAHKQTLPSAFMDITLDEQFLEDVHQNVQGCFQDDRHLIPEVLWLIMDKQSTPPTTPQNNKLLKLILLLIKHTQGENLANTIKITNQLTRELAKTNHDQKQNVINELIDTIVNAPTALEDESPWDTTIASLCTALQLQATIKSPQQACDAFVGIVQHEPYILKLMKVLLLTFFNATSYKAACCFEFNSLNQKNFTDTLFAKLANAPKEQFDILEDLLNKTVMAATQEYSSDLTIYLSGNISLFSSIGKSINPKTLDMALDLYKKGQQLDNSLHIDATVFNPLCLMDILSNRHFSLEQKQQTIHTVLSNQSDENIKKIIFDYYQVESNQDTSMQQCVFFQLVELHNEDKHGIAKLLIFLQALPSYTVICKLLWSSANLLDDACSATNYEKLIPCAIATYNACIVDTNQRRALPLKTVGKTIGNSWRWAKTLLSSDTPINRGTIVYLFAFLLDKQSLSDTKLLLFLPIYYMSGVMFDGLMDVDNDGSIAGIIHSHIMNYQYEENFTELWPPYIQALLRVLRRKIAEYELRDDGNYTSPQVLQLLPPEEWVDVFYNISSASKRSEALDPGKLQPETLHNAKGETFPEIALPYLLLALGMYFKDYTSPFNYTNRATAFLDNMRVLLGSKKAQLSENNFSGSPFNNLYQQLPKTALSKEGRKQAFTFLYEFCLKESNNPDNANKENFQKLVLQPLAKRLKSLFTTDKATLKVSSSSHAFDDKDETVGAAASSSAVAAAPETPTQTVYGKNGSGERHVQFEMTIIAPTKVSGAPSPNADRL